MECLTESAEDRQRKTESHEPAENRNARLKDEMERGENMAGLIALIAIIFLLSISSICSMIDGTVL